MAVPVEASLSKSVRTGEKALTEQYDFLTTFKCECYINRLNDGDKKHPTVCNEGQNLEVFRPIFSCCSTSYIKT